MAEENKEQLGNEASQGAIAPAETTTQPAQAPSTPIDGQPAAPPVAQPQAEEAISIREAAKQYGVDLSAYPDDAAALQALISQTQANQQLQQLAPYGQLYMQHANEFNSWLTDKQKADAARASQEKQTSFWQAPEFDPRWRQMISKNAATGAYEVAQGAPPEILPKFLKYADWLDQQQTKFWQNPVETIKPGIEGVVQSIVQEAITKELGSYREQQYSQQYVQQNASWLFQNDGKGNFNKDMSGRPMLTDEGKAFYGYLQEASSTPDKGGLGIQGIERQEAYARSMVQRDLAIKAVNDSKSVSDDKKKQFLTQNAAAPASHSASTVPGTPRADGTTDPQNQKLTLADRLRMDLKQAGTTDDDIRNGVLVEA